MDPAMASREPNPVSILIVVDSENILQGSNGDPQGHDVEQAPRHQENESSSIEPNQPLKDLSNGGVSKSASSHSPSPSNLSSISTLAQAEKKSVVEVNIELTDLKVGLGNDTPATLSGASTPTTAVMPLEGLGFTSSDARDQPGISKPYMNQFRLLAISLLNFTNALGDSAAGALLPSIQNQYNLTYATVSLIFVGQTLGYIIAAPIIDAVRVRYGNSKALAATQLLLAVGMVPMIITAPYPLVILSFFVFGISESFNLAIGNVFCGSLSNGTTALGIMHGAYGLGGTVGPLVATSLVTRTSAVWGTYYFIVVGFALVNCCFSSWCFWGYERELIPTATGNGSNLAEAGRADEVVVLDGVPIMTGGEGTATTAKKDSAAVASLYGILSAATSKVVLLGSMFLFCYQGAEVSVSGWVLSFLLEHRKADRQTVGYVTAGFWAGITLGRFLLSTPAQWIGEKKFVYGTMALAAGFELIVWLVPNIAADFVAVAILGFLMGPVYPCAAAVFMRTMNKDEQVRGMVIMATFGSSGGAVAPFTTGMLAHAVGTFVLHPIVIALFGVVLACWYCLPGKPKNMK